MSVNNIVRNTFVFCCASLSFCLSEAKTLCSYGEQTIFSCLAKEKTISICASPDASPTSGYLMYRFGLAGKKPELSFPSIGVKPGAAFTYRSGGSSSGRTEQLEFHVGKYKYTVYSDHYGGLADPLEDGGVIVENGDQKISNISCTDPLAPDGMGLYLGVDPVGKSTWHTVGLPSGTPRSDIPN